MTETRILVTGAAGFLGYHLARALAARPGVELICVDDFRRGADDSWYAELIRRPNVTGLRLDLARESDVAQLPPGMDYVYHLAALNGTQNFYERPLEVIRACTLPTIFLAEHFSRQVKPLRRFVYAGTSEAYAATVSRFGWPVPTAEDVPLGIDDVTNPRWSYAASKMHGEVVTALAGQAAAMPFTIIRYHNAYGPRMGDKHIVPDFMERMREGRFELYGHADTRSFLYVDDAVRATMMAAESASLANEIVNIGGEREITMLDLGRKILAVEAIRADITLHDAPAGSVKRRVPDVGKLRRLTGFAERVELDQGLKVTADFYLRGEMAGPLKTDDHWMV